jgi:predicted dehydrogenase
VAEAGRASPPYSATACPAGACTYHRRVVVGLVGCGRWGVNILRDLRTLGCEVPVVARSPGSAARARDGGAHAVVGEVAALRGADGVVVATPTTTHAAVIDEALALGVPVFVEKPLCNRREDAERLAATADGRLFVMDKWRYHPGVRALAGIAFDGRLGLVHGLRTIRVGWGARHDDVDATWVLAPHDLAIALEILGEIPSPVAAAASAVDGRVVVLHGLLRTGAAWHALEVSERASTKERRVELHCEGGVAVLEGGWDDHATVLQPANGGERRAERVETPGELPLLAELRAFVGHLAGGPPPHSTADEGRAVVDAVARLRELAAVA